MTKTKRQERRDWGRDLIMSKVQPGDTIWGCVRTVSRSGMSRTMTLHVACGDEIQDVTYAVAALFDQKLNHRGALRVDGCGMDMIFKTVYDIGRVCYPEGFDCIEPNEVPGSHRCPSNDHSNFDTRNFTGRHKDGGYAFRSRCL